jgi:hypothetical protein
MNRDTLLKPRYKVIADYPLSKMYFNIGDILYWDEKYESYRINEKQVAMNKDTVESFPHLFRRLEWWEERMIEELPKYLRYSKYDGGAVYQVLYYSPNDNPWLAYIKGATSQRNQLNFALKDTTPATQAEFEEYQTQNKKT